MKPSDQTRFVDVEKTDSRPIPGIKELESFRLPSGGTHRDREHKDPIRSHLSSIADLLKRGQYEAANLLLTTQSVVEKADLPFEFRIMVISNFPTNEKLLQYIGRAEEEVRGRKVKLLSVEVHPKADLSTAKDEDRHRMKNLIHDVALINLGQWMRAFHEKTGTTITRDARLLPSELAYKTDLPLFIMERGLNPTPRFLNNHMDDKGIALLNQTRDITRELKTVLDAWNGMKNSFVIGAAGRETIPDIALSMDGVSNKHLVIEKISDDSYRISNGAQDVYPNFFLNRDNRWEHIPRGEGVVAPGGAQITIGHMARFRLPFPPKTENDTEMDTELILP